MSSAKASLTNRVLAQAREQRPLSATWLIVKKELYINFLSLKIPAAFVAMTAFFLLSVHLLAADYQQRLDNWAANNSVQGRPAVGGVVAYRLADGTFYHTAGAAHESALQPPTALSVIVKGMDSEWSRTTTLGQTIGFGPKEDEKPSVTLFNIPDPAYVIQMLVSLLALFFALESVSREKETGTLRALMATPLQRREILLGKALGVCISLCVPFAVAYAISIAYLHYSHGLLVEAEDLPRVFLILCLCLIYALVFTCVGLFISTITTKIKTAVMTSLLVWGAVVLVLPDVAVLMARLSFPSPSYNQLNVQLREGRQTIIDEELGPDTPHKSVLESPRARAILLRTFEMDRAITDLYISRKWEQVEGARYMSLLSPAGALKFGASDLAGTGATTFKSYLDFLVSGRDAMTDAMKRQWDLPVDERSGFLQRIMGTLSARQHQTPPLSESLGPAAMAAGSLLLWAGVLWVLVHRRFEQYDAR